MKSLNYDTNKIEIESKILKLNFNIKKLGKAIYNSPIKNIDFTDDKDRIIYDVNYTNLLKNIKKNELNKIVTLEKAGPGKKLFFDSSKVIAGIVTCGGLCPGLNNVIRALVMQLTYQYKVTKILGFRYGFQGIYRGCKTSPIYLTPKDVEPIHNRGGSFLSSSRGVSNQVKIVDGLVDYGINILFTIGGDGTIRASCDIQSEIEKRGLNISIVNIPKTIDNDIPIISRSFGFETAFSEAVESIRCAHNEATGAPNGIGIVKVMGRDSGFIAAQAALAQKDVNYVLIPELDFNLEGPGGLFNVLKKRLAKKSHALIVVAEGAGQKIFNAISKKDASGNKVLNDIGLYLKKSIGDYFKSKKINVNIKYIDPSYIIRSVCANPADVVYCGFLGEHAVHAAMSGRTRVIIGIWNEKFVYLPMDIVRLGRNNISSGGTLWQSILLSTGQPPLK